MGLKNSTLALLLSAITFFPTIAFSQEDNSTLKGCYYLGRYDVVQKLSEKEYWITETYIGSQIITGGLILITETFGFDKMGRSFKGVFATKVGNKNVKLRDGTTVETTIFKESPKCTQAFAELKKKKEEIRYQELYGERSEDLSKYLLSLVKEENFTDCTKLLLDTQKVVFSPNLYGKNRKLLYRDELNKLLDKREELVRICVTDIKEVGKKKEMLKKYRSTFVESWVNGLKVALYFKDLENLRHAAKNDILNFPSYLKGPGDISSFYQYNNNNFDELKNKKIYSSLKKFFDEQIAIHVDATKDLILKDKTIDKYNTAINKYLKNKLTSTIEECNGVTSKMSYSDPVKRYVSLSCSTGARVYNDFDFIQHDEWDSKVDYYYFDFRNFKAAKADITDYNAQKCKLKSRKKRTWADEYEGFPLDFIASKKPGYWRDSYSKRIICRETINVKKLTGDYCKGTKTSRKKLNGLYKKCNKMKKQSKFHESSMKFKYCMYDLIEKYTTEIYSPKRKGDSFEKISENRKIVSKNLKEKIFKEAKDLGIDTKSFSNCESIMSNEEVIVMTDTSNYNPPKKWGDKGAIIRSSLIKPLDLVLQDSLTDKDGNRKYIGKPVAVLLSKWFKWPYHSRIQECEDYYALSRLEGLGICE